MTMPWPEELQSQSSFELAPSSETWCTPVHDLDKPRSRSALVASFVVRIGRDCPDSVRHLIKVIAMEIRETMKIGSVKFV